MSFALDRSAIEISSVLPSSFSLQTLSAPAPGIVLFLNRDKPKTRQGQVFLVNASQVFEKGDPKNFIPDAGIDRIVDALVNWKEEEKFSRIVESGTAERDSASKKTEGTSQVVSEARDNLKKNDYNISPSRYIHTSDAETYRPIAEIVEELKVIEFHGGKVAEISIYGQESKLASRRLARMNLSRSLPRKRIGQDPEPLSFV